MTSMTLRACNISLYGLSVKTPLAAVVNNDVKEKLKDKNATIRNLSSEV